MGNTEWGFSTEQVHAGIRPDGGHGARITPVYLSNGFLFDDFDQARERFAGESEGYYYTRYGNPTIAAVERKLAGLEHGVDALAVASGQAALTIAFLTLLKQGDHVVSARSIYEGTRGLLREDFARFGITATFATDPNDAEALAAAFQPNTKAVFIETIPNPRNDVPDLELVTRVAHEHGVPVIVDNTLGTPFHIRPIEHGADLVVHSTSKFLSGHGSAIGGAIVDSGSKYLTDAFADGHTVNDETFTQKARSLAGRFGPTLSPFNAFLLQHGIETLSLRMREQSGNALKVAQWLESRPEVASIDYSGLDSSPYHANAERYLENGYGAVFAFTLRGGLPAAEALINGVTLWSRMTHLGDVRSLILHPASTTHIHLTAAELAENGIEPGTIRLSVGIEDVSDLIADLEQALVAD
ncbi:O-acetylhomoserine aminocarboxypropyltransferase/cysteine synthase family protein [Gryllotalpicola protaetiae]|uniref:homocysteine desulfhydrase n=1 Tax=Gryllotalpicola protaetiae TaxID=2419771 RepID=A0A387BYR4_9MICO|nr:aminotransferase class I/II-fold pyridoxal phosphate-dependent enzyme [Gryllotalpicola protaetiae]AYG03481.1 O-acetylhomoserine aminocarboxypropyltransferase/cysteine synthase [Gryllotalpicola protaetiae]